MKKEILIYEEDKEVLKFLRSFFRERNDYSTCFIKKGGEALRELLLKMRPAALIVSSPDGLENMKTSEVECPVIATITSANITRGIHCVVKSDVGYYLLAPFYKEDLEHKLKLAVERKRWLENLYKERKDLKVLTELTYLLTSTLNPKEVLNLIVKKISEILKMGRCSIISIDMEDQGCGNVVSASENSRFINRRIDLQKYPEIRRAVSLKMPVIVRDALKDPIMEEVRDKIVPINIRSILVMPIIFHDDVMGTLLLRTTKKIHTFSKREIKLCAAIANASANALYNALLYDKLNGEKKFLEKLAITDYLTGIYNVRYFYKRLEEEFSRSVRYNTPLSCIMIDIDYFKNINDTYGHRIGDIVLREFAQFVRGHTRKSDIFARYGGEEFIMLLPQTSLKGAMLEAERIRKAVSEYQFMGLEEGYKVTVSIGIACFPDKKIKTPNDLINFADNTLFTAKNKGRNQIIVYPSL